MSRYVDNLDGLLQRWRRWFLLLLLWLWFIDELIRIIGDILRFESFKLLIVLKVAELVLPLALHFHLGLVVLGLHWIKVILLLVRHFQALVSFVLKVKLGEIVVLNVCIVVRLPGCLQRSDHLVDGEGKHKHGEEGGRTEEPPPWGASHPTHLCSLKKCIQAV